MTNAGKKKSFLINENGMAKTYAKGMLTNKSFHHDNGDNIKPNTTKKLCQALFHVNFFLNINIICFVRDFTLRCCFTGI